MSKYKDLDGLLWQAVKTAKPAAAPPSSPKPEVRLWFDADRFRWYFKNRDGLSIQDWRDKIDQEILNANSEHPTSG